jgi:transcriptional regulator with XRE-family HTH domain
MSKRVYEPFPEDPRLQPAAALAFFVERRRARLNLTVEEAARLTGLEISQWQALESGWVPEDRLDIQAIAAVLEVPEEDLQSFVDMHRLQQAS